MTTQGLVPATPGNLPAARDLSAADFDSFTAYLDAAPRTVDTYRKALRHFALYLAAQGLRKPCRQDILNYRDDLKATGHKPATVQMYITAVRLFFAWTEQEGIYPNIAEHIKGARVSKDHKKDYLTSSQVRDILQHIGPDSRRNYAMFLLMVTGGLRTVEVSRANIEDLRTLGGTTVLYIQGKGQEDRADFVKIPEQTEHALRAYLAERPGTSPGDPLFTSASNNSRGQRLTTRAIRGIIKNELQRAGYNSDRLTAHSLRHTAVTLSLLAGRDLAEVQQFARHSNISTTMIYNHAIDKAKNGCSEAVSAAIFT